MNFIDKILFEGLYADTDTIYDLDYYTKVTPKEIKRKAYKLAARFNVHEVQQAKTGSCYFIIFNPIDHFIYEVRISNHPPIKKEKFNQVIELTYSQSLDEMIKIIKNTIYHKRKEG